MASSWRNKIFPEVVKRLRAEGFDVYDFRTPVENDAKKFEWSDISKDWQQWSAEKFREQLSHPLAERAFLTDWNACLKADAAVLLLPCGRSAHLEAGYFIGAKKPLIVLLSDAEPELMYKMTPDICLNIDEVIAALRKYFPA
ncbi:MAG: hypothetical protein ACOY3I_00140 [Verrucomicrobiota bacterium]